MATDIRPVEEGSPQEMMWVGVLDYCIIDQ